MVVLLLTLKVVLALLMYVLQPIDDLVCILSGHAIGILIFVRSVIFGKIAMLRTAHTRQGAVRWDDAARWRRHSKCKEAK